MPVRPPVARTSTGMAKAVLWPTPLIPAGLITRRLFERPLAQGVTSWGLMWRPMITVRSLGLFRHVDHGTMVTGHTSNMK
jgi:hypothetical protein